MSNFSYSIMLFTEHKPYTYVFLNILCRPQQDQGESARSCTIPPDCVMATKDSGRIRHRWGTEFYLVFFWHFPPQYP
ncbi:hypothetical protein XELAEV_18027120mg [Xenopus laevis]|uniref:Uncharacterized protein n=1 Tax=Xenopus laevis TaxID=8355 RepID=A0A974CWV9_XENLA|nr:hypothetical protein XELAEV_18027120mg [Xenopus laevis]